jgi:hypothetical protein
LVFPGTISFEHYLGMLETPGIGAGQSRVSFFINKFLKLGFIEYNGKLEVKEIGAE